jgi:hypothetical protein
MTGFVSNSGQQPPPPQAPAGVGAALGAVGSAIGGMLSQQAIDSTKAEVRKLVDSAKSGGFAISEEGANEYVRVFQNFEDVLIGLLQELDAAKQAPELGGSPYAKQIVAHIQLIASGDAQSYETALLSLKEIVGQARQAFEEAKKRYADMEDQAVQTFGGVKP